jgi:hypothetical protein
MNIDKLSKIEFIKGKLVPNKDVRKGEKWKKY